MRRHITPFAQKTDGRTKKQKHGMTWKVFLTGSLDFKTSLLPSQRTKKLELVAGIAEGLHPFDCPSFRPEKLSQWGFNGGLSAGSGAFH